MSCNYFLKFLVSSTKTASQIQYSYFMCDRMSAKFVCLLYTLRHPCPGSFGDSVYDQRKLSQIYVRVNNVIREAFKQIDPEMKDVNANDVRELLCLMGE